MKLIDSLKSEEKLDNPSATVIFYDTIYQKKKAGCLNLLHNLLNRNLNSKRHKNTRNIHIRGIFFVAFIGTDYNRCL